MKTKQFKKNNILIVQNFKKLFSYCKMFNGAGALVLYFPLSNNGSIVGINNINKEINKTIVVYKKKK
jgi:hypothetical protein